MRIVLTNDEVKEAIASYLNTVYGKDVFSPSEIEDLIVTAITAPGEKLEYRFDKLRVVLDETR